MFFLFRIKILVVAIFLFLTTNMLALGTLEPAGNFFGTRDSQRVGYYLSAAGDINADGYDDFMVAGYHHYNVSSEDWNSGGVFLFLGKQNFPTIDEQPITNANAIFEGYRKNDMVGYNVAGKGDFNGDGYDDMLIGAPGKWETNLPNNGYLYVVLGRPEANWPKPSKIKDIADFSLVGESYLDQLGYAVDFAGDLNQDGFDDIVISAAFKDFDGQQWAGKVYVIAGSAKGFQGEIPIADAAVASFIFPENEATLGYSVAGVEDVNADGYPDFAIGAEGAGQCFLIFGKEQLDWGHDFNLSGADVIFTPEKRFDRPGWQIRPAGDVNADEIPDFLISGVSLNYSFGKLYLLLGRSTWPDTVSLTQADASFIGEHSGAHAGMSMDGVGDFDGDGFDDFAVGSRWFDYNDFANAGKEYLIKGRAAGWEQNVSLKTVPDYFTIQDSIYCLGWGTAGTGDFDGDFRPDFIASAPFCSNNDLHWNGRIYLFKANYELPAISGACHYFHSGNPIYDVTVNMDGNQHRQMQTGSDGDYAFTVGLNQSWKITPSPEPDLSALSAYDAALIARYTISEDYPLLNPVSADVNQDSQINIMDGIFILRAVVGFPPDTASHAGEWNFTPESRFFPDVNISHTEADFSGFVIGDVDLSWPDPMQQTANPQISLARLQPAVQRHADRTLIPLTVTSQTDAYSFEAEFSSSDGTGT